MLIDKYKDYFGYIDPEGISHQDADGLLTGYFLKICGCGESEELIKTAFYILKTLDLKDDNAHWPLYTNEQKLIIQYLDWIGLVTHGSSLPHGWLTDKGKEFMVLVRELYPNTVEVK